MYKRIIKIVKSCPGIWIIPQICYSLSLIYTLTSSPYITPVALASG